MSDSHQEANNSKTAPARAPVSGSVEDGAEAGPDGVAVGETAGAGVPVSSEPNEKSDRPAGKKRGTPLIIGILVVLLIAGLSLFAALLAMQFIAKDDARAPSLGDGSQSRLQSGGNDAPVSILPDEPGGVTIVQKQADNSPGAPLITAPVAAGAGVAIGFGMDVGAADSFIELSQRFAAIVATNGESNFNRLEPRAILRETVSGLEARLLIGPFETSAAAQEACGVLVLDDGLECTSAPFEGELISRE